MICNRSIKPLAADCLSTSGIDVNKYVDVHEDRNDEREDGDGMPLMKFIKKKKLHRKNH